MDNDGKTGWDHLVVMRAIKLIPSNSQDVNGWVWDRRGGDGYLLNIKHIWDMEIETS